MEKEVGDKVQTPNYPGLDRGADETAPEDAESVRVDLPWVPLSYRGEAFLTQVVLRDRASAVKDAIRLYMECREQPIFNPSLHGELTVHIWRVLQAAHPHHLWQWWEWEQVYHQFNQRAEEFLRKSKVAQETTIPSALVGAKFGS